MIEADDPICVSAALLLRSGKDIIKESKASYSCIRDLISWRILQERPQLLLLLPGDLAAVDPHIQPGHDGGHSGGAHTWTSS